MGFYSKSRVDPFDHFAPAQRTLKLWDPVTALDIINPSRGALTCVGYAPSQGRRCRNPINQANRASAFRLLESLSCIDSSTVEIIEKLRELARLTLCLWYHQNQNHNIVQTWSRQMDEQQESKVKNESPARGGQKIKVEDEFTFPSPTGHRYRKQYNAHLTQEDLDWLRQEVEARKWKDQGRDRQQREHEEREQKEKEQKKREQEQRQKKDDEEKRYKKEKEARARAAREQEDRNESIRQKAEKMSKEREERAKKQAEEEREEWDKIWLQYGLRWDDIKKNGTRGSSEHLQKVIPWPVKSGKCEDVSAAAIEEFFRKAPPKETSAKKMVGLIKMECLKWHTDRSPRMFGMIEDKVLASLFNIVAQVVIKIRAELGRR